MALGLVVQVSQASTLDGPIHSGENDTIPCTIDDPECFGGCKRGTNDACLLACTNGRNGTSYKGDAAGQKSCASGACSDIDCNRHSYSDPGCPSASEQESVPKTKKYCP
jgi:hypothetical protein